MTNHDEILAEVVEWIRGHYFGKYRGTVVDTLDPLQQGRVLVTAPAVLGDVEVWAMPSVPYAGDGVGLYLIPAAGSGVWIEFEAGDPSYPIWTGCFWGSGQLPDMPMEDVKVLRTGSHTIRLDDLTGELLVAADSGGETAYSFDVVTSAGGGSHSVSALGVTSEKGMMSVEVTDAGTSINGTAVKAT